jgi:Tfp pilus assembly protein PilO
MRQKAFYLFVVTATFAIGFYVLETFLFSDQPNRIRSLQDKIEILNEKLISAEILDQNTDEVSTLFEKNLALSKLDSLAEEASLPFLNSITNTINNLGIILISIQPKNRIVKENHIKTPYELEIECDWEQFGMLLAEMERSVRLITLEEFSMRNPIEQLKNLQNIESLMKQEYEIKLTTLTLIKQKRG